MASRFFHDISESGGFPEGQLAPEDAGPFLGLRTFAEPSGPARIEFENYQFLFKSPEEGLATEKPPLLQNIQE